MAALDGRDGVRVLRLRVRVPAGAGPGGPALRLRLERLLGAAALRPRGMPAGAVLIVRHMDGRAPAGRGGAHSWGDALAARMEQLYREAARPAAGPPPAVAASVRFADAGELLACLTADLVEGRAGGRWYWQAILRELPPRPGAALAALWCARPVAVPAALAALPPATTRAAALALRPDEAVAVMSALRAAFAVAPPGPAPSAAAPAPAKPAPQDSGRSAARSASLEPALSAAPDAPWRPWLPRAVEAGLPPASVALLGLALGLWHAPALARGAAFATAADAYLAAVAQAARGPAAAPSPVNAPPPAAPRAIGAGPAGARQASRQAPGGPPAHAAAQLRAGDPARLAAPSHGTAPALHAPRETAPAPLTSGDAGVRTELAGALYLANLLGRLGLPGAWGDDTLSAGLGGWGLIEALARGLLGPAHARHTADPLWPALAELAGRPPGQPASAGMRRAPAFRLPAAWPRRYGPHEPVWSASVCAGRLRLWSPGLGRPQPAVLVAEAPVGRGGPAAAAEAIVAAYAEEGLRAVWRPGGGARLAPLEAGAAAAIGPGAAWWLERALGFVRGLLGAMLADPATDAAARLLRVPGRLHLSRTHVDLHMPIDRISIAARRAGLDRDPGWAPDLGRIVLFHFDESL